MTMPAREFQAPKENPSLSGSQGSRNGYLGASSFNARVLLETQELLRQEQRRKEQEANKARLHAQETLSGSMYSFNSRDNAMVPGQAPPQSKGPYRHDVPPSPTQLTKLSGLQSSDKGRPFYSWVETRAVGIKQQGKSNTVFFNIYIYIKQSFMALFIHILIWIFLHF